MKNNKIYALPFVDLYQLYVTKVERKNQSKDDLDTIIYWLTGYDQKQLENIFNDKIDVESFYLNAPKLNENVTLIKGAICGYRFEDNPDDMMKKIRYLDKLVDELARGRKMDKILRK